MQMILQTPEKLTILWMLNEKRNRLVKISAIALWRWFVELLALVCVA